jgi:hypothetical protein
LRHRCRDRHKPCLSLTPWLFRRPRLETQPDYSITWTADSKRDCAYDRPTRLLGPLRHWCRDRHNPCLSATPWLVHRPRPETRPDYSITWTADSTRDCAYDRPTRLLGPWCRDRHKPCVCLAPRFVRRPWLETQKYRGIALAAALNRDSAYVYSSRLLGLSPPCRHGRHKPCVCLAPLRVSISRLETHQDRGIALAAALNRDSA